MSIISKRTSTSSSILRDHSSTNRARYTQEQKNKVRFSLSVNQNVAEILNCVEQNGNVLAYDEYICMLTTTALSDEAFRKLVLECKECIPLLQPKYVRLVETILGLPWMNREQAVLEEYKAFVVELLVTHNKYTRFAISKLVNCWIPEGKLMLICSHELESKLSSRYSLHRVPERELAVGNPECRNTGQVDKCPRSDK